MGGGRVWKRGSVTEGMFLDRKPASDWARNGDELERTFKMTSALCGSFGLVYIPPTTPHPRTPRTPFDRTSPVGVGSTEVCCP